MMRQDNNYADDTSDIEEQLIACGEVLKSHLTLKERVVEQTQMLLPKPAAMNNGLLFLRRSFSSITSFEGSNAVRNLSIGTLAVVSLIVIIAWTQDSRLTLAQAIETIHKVTSYTAEFSMENRAAAASDRVTMTGKLYWQAPDELRTESKLARSTLGAKASPDIIEITSSSKPGMRFHVASKELVELAPRSGAKSPLTVLQNLEKYKSVATKVLGSKSIDGNACAGFEIDLRDVDPDGGDGELEVWFDVHSQLPRRVIIHMAEQFAPVDLIYQNFSWNVAVDQKLFQVEKPVDYTTQVAKDSGNSDEQSAAKIMDALRLYAELNNGRYPEVKVIYGDVAIAKLRQLSKIDHRTFEELQKDVQLKDRYLKIEATMEGWEEANRIMRENPTAQYNGLTVSSSDKDKVLFKWRRSDGKYQVIHADLSTSLQPK